MEDDRHPEVEEPEVIETEVTENEVTEPVVEDSVPRSKEDWNKLAETDIDKWRELTQQRTDQLVRTTRETADENERLKTELANMKVQGEIPKEVEEGGEVVYSQSNLPKTDEDWNTLAIDDPVKFSDLRAHYNRQREKVQNSFLETQATSRRIVQAEHPDMYLPELDGTGQPKMDEKGNPVLQLNPQTGEPIFNPNSEKGKLWIAEYQKDPSIERLKDAPEVLMAKMERTLRVKGERLVKENQPEIKQNQVAPDGAPPPMKTKATFSSEEEKVHATAAIARGVYTSLEQYCELRDKGDVGIYDEDSTPKFK